MEIQNEQATARRPILTQTVESLDHLCAQREVEMNRSRCANTSSSSTATGHSTISPFGTLMR